MSFAAIPAIAAVVGGGLQAYSSIQQGYSQKAQYEARRDELERDRELAEIAAKQSQASVYSELQKTLGAQTALVATRGLSLDSPSFTAIQDSTQRQADKETGRQIFMTAQQSSAARLAGRAAVMSGRSAVTGGYLAGVGHLFTAAGLAKSYYDSRPKTPAP